VSVPVETYGMKKSVSRELATRQRTDTERLLRQEIEGRVRAEGYEPLPGQFSCRWVSPEEMALDPMSFSDEGSIFARDRGYFLAFVQVRCSLKMDTPSPQLDSA
jgi:UPF0288 family protein (methanogenesis marker protein 3)